MAATIKLSSFPFSEEITCPHCFKKVTVYDPSGSEYYVCNGCHFYLHKSATNSNIMTMQQVPKPKSDPLIPIGATGTLMQLPYKMIAYMEKQEVGTEYTWREYMLYNYSKGYAFLAEYDGHWTLIAGIDHYPELAQATVTSDDATCNGVEYLVFNKYVPKINGLTGEYDWDVFEERIRATEYVNPPYLFVKEQNNRNRSIVDYYHGTYLDAKEIASAFNIDISNFPDKLGVGANEPSPWRYKWPKVFKMSGIIAIVVMLIQLAIVFLKPETVLLDQNFTLSPQQTEKPDSAKRTPVASPVQTGQTDSTVKSAAIADILKAQADSLAQANSNTSASDRNGNFELKPFKTASFNVEHGPAPLQFDISSPVDNNWFEANIELVNEKDNQTWTVGKEVDYYHGYEDGDSWSEGSVTEDVLLSGIPEGRYHMNIYPYAGYKYTNGMSIKVTENVTLWRNVLLTLLVLCLYPLFVWYMRRRFEMKRWMMSDYSPFVDGSNEEDEE